MLLTDFTVLNISEFKVFGLVSLLKFEISNVRMIFFLYLKFRTLECSVYEQPSARSNGLFLNRKEPFPLPVRKKIKFLLDIKLKR